MIKTLEAIYQEGQLRLMEPIELQESAIVQVQVEIPNTPAVVASGPSPVEALERLVELTRDAGEKADAEDLQSFMDRVRERD